MDFQSEGIIHSGPVTDMYRELLAGKIRGRATDFFIYSTEFLPLGASATATGNINIQNDADFIIVAGVITSRDTGTGAAQTTFPFLVQMTYGSSGRNLFDRAQDAENIFGTAQRPAWWTMPKFLQRGGVLSIQAQNIIATARNVRMAFWGFKIFTTNMGQ